MLKENVSCSDSASMCRLKKRSTDTHILLYVARFAGNIGKWQNNESLKPTIFKSCMIKGAISSNKVYSETQVSLCL